MRINSTTTITEPGAYAATAISQSTAAVAVNSALSFNGTTSYTFHQREGLVQDTYVGSLTREAKVFVGTLATETERETARFSVWGQSRQFRQFLTNPHPITQFISSSSSWTYERSQIAGTDTTTTTSSSSVSRWTNVTISSTTHADPASVAVYTSVEADDVTSTTSAASARRHLFTFSSTTVTSTRTGFRSSSTSTTTYSLPASTIVLGDTTTTSEQRTSTYTRTTASSGPALSSATISTSFNHFTDAVSAIEAVPTRRDHFSASDTILFSTKSTLAATITNPTTSFVIPATDIFSVIESTSTRDNNAITTGTGKMTTSYLATIYNDSALAEYSWTSTASEEIEVDTSTFTDSDFTFTAYTYTETASYPVQTAPGTTTSAGTRTRTNTSFSSSMSSSTFTDTTTSTYTVSGTMNFDASDRLIFSTATDAVVGTISFAVPHLSLNSLTTIAGTTTTGGVISETHTAATAKDGLIAAAAGNWTGTHTTTSAGDQSFTTARGSSYTITRSLSVPMTSATFETTENLRMSASITEHAFYSYIAGGTTGQALTFAIENDATKLAILQSAAASLTACYHSNGRGYVPFTSTRTTRTGATSVTHRLSTGAAWGILATLQTTISTSTTTSWGIGAGGSAFAFALDAFGTTDTFLGAGWNGGQHFVSGNSTSSMLWRFTQSSGAGRTTGSSHKSFTALTSSMQRHMETVAHATVSIGPGGGPATASFSPDYPDLWND